MNDPINVVRLRQPDEVDDPLTEVLRAGARRLLAQAVELGVRTRKCAVCPLLDQLTLHLGYGGKDME